MKRFIFISALILNVLISCISPEIPLEGEGNTITLSVSVAGFQATGRSSTRTTTMTAEEKAIHTLYVIQFDGTDNSSVVIKSGFAELKGDKYACDFQIMDKACTFYFIANMLPRFTVATGTTLADFLKSKVPFICFEGVPVTGLPMYNISNINFSIQSPDLSITLKPLVARLALTYNADAAGLNLTGGQLPDCNLKGYLASCFGERPAGQSGSWFPAGATDNAINFGSNANLSKILYVSENMAGEGIVSGGWMYRTPSTAPPGAMYIQFDCPTNSGMYYIRFYIGDQFKLKDFNIRRGYTYDVLLSISNLDTNDPRVTQISTP